jgi:hypothetical protein
MPKSVNAGCRLLRRCRPSDTLLNFHFAGDLTQPVFVFAELLGAAADGRDVVDLGGVHGSSRLSGDLGCRRRSVPGQQLVQPMGGMSCDAREDVGQPSLWADTVHLGR